MKFLPISILVLVGLAAAIPEPQGLFRVRVLEKFILVQDIIHLRFGAQF